jgi:hypothetical protein
MKKRYEDIEESIIDFIFVITIMFFMIYGCLSIVGVAGL